MDGAAPRGNYLSYTPTEQHQMDALGLAMTHSLHVLALTAPFQFFLDLCPGLAQDILDDGLACDRISSRGVPTFPAAIFSFANIAFSVCPMLSHISPLSCCNIVVSVVVHFPILPVAATPFCSLHLPPAALANVPICAI